MMGNFSPTELPENSSKWRPSGKFLVCLLSIASLRKMRDQSGEFLFWIYFDQGRSFIWWAKSDGELRGK